MRRGSENDREQKREVVSQTAIDPAQAEGRTSEDSSGVVAQWRVIYASVNRSSLRTYPRRVQRLGGEGAVTDVLRARQRSSAWPLLAAFPSTTFSPV